MSRTLFLPDDYVAEHQGSGGTGVHTDLIATVLIEIDDHKAVVPLIDGLLLTGVDARCSVAVLIDAILIDNHSKPTDSYSNHCRGRCQ